ncbi:MAG TPA: hypothetical protein VIO57_01290 [Chloroflexota bacterium]
MEFETERVDSGDGVWAQPGIVGYVLWEPALPGGIVNKDGDYCMTACGCLFTPREIDALDDAATKAAGEGPSEP